MIKQDYLIRMIQEIISLIVNAILNKKNWFLFLISLKISEDDNIFLVKQVKSLLFLYPYPIDRAKITLKRLHIAL